MIALVCNIRFFLIIRVNQPITTHALNCVLSRQLSRWRVFGEKSVNQFGHIADDLTSLEMKVEGMLDRAHAKALKAALQRAFVEACKASRAQRLEEEGGTPESGAPNRSVAHKVRKAGPARSALQKKRPAIMLRSAHVGA